MTKKKKIVYTNTFLKSLEDLTKDMTPKEIKDLEASLQELADIINDGTFIEKSHKVDMEKLQKEEPEMYEQLVLALHEDKNSKEN